MAIRRAAGTIGLLLACAVGTRVKSTRAAQCRSVSYKDPEDPRGRGGALIGSRRSTERRDRDTPELSHPLQPLTYLVPTNAGLVHQPPFSIAGEGCPRSAKCEGRPVHVATRATLASQPTQEQISTQLMRADRPAHTWTTRRRVKSWR